MPAVAKKNTPTKRKPAKRAPRVATKTSALELLSGGNPRITKGDGDVPVQAYIATMPGWKREVGRRLDALITETIPGVSKVIRWNSPMYGLGQEGWFLGLHVFAKYIKVAFFRGTSLRPMPPGESKGREWRYLDIREGDDLDKKQLVNWIKQAAELPGWRP